MAESKVQKAAQQGTAPTPIGACQCGGDLVWVRVGLRSPHMVKACERCGANQPRA